MKKIILIGNMFLFLTACGMVAPRYFCRYDTTQGRMSAENEYFKATIIPAEPREYAYEGNYPTGIITTPGENSGYILKKAYTAFILTIVNKTSQDLELDWNKTLYIYNGETKGGFMFEGIVYKDRNNPKPPDIIFANSTFTKVIFPNSNVQFTSWGWEHIPLPLGENGIYLVVKVGEKEIKEKLNLVLSREKDEIK